MARALTLLLLVAAIIGLGAIVIFVDMPENTRFYQTAFTAGHTIIFGFCALAFLQLIIVLRRQQTRLRLLDYVLAFVFAVLVGIATEIIQGFVGRDSEVSDVLRDALGAATFLFVAMTFDHRLAWDFRFAKAVRHAVRFIAPLLIVLVFLPAIKWGLSYLYRDHEFPVIGSFNSTIMRQFMRTADAKLTITDPPAGWAGKREKVGKLTFYRTTYPGILFRELSPNWSGYSALAFDIFSERQDTVDVELRVNDRHHNEKYSDRFNTSLHVAPGLNDVVIPLEELRNAPASRKMDLSDMGTIVLFAYKPKDTFSVYLSDVRLQ